MAKLRRVPPGVGNYNQFKTRWAPQLQADLEQGKNPLSGLHPFRLHRAYMAASQMDRSLLARLPWLVLETEMRIKGDSAKADVAVAVFLARLVAAVNAGAQPVSSRARRSP